MSSYIMKRTVVSLEDAKELTKKMDYVIAHGISTIARGNAEDTDIPWDELVELRAFSETSEVHVFELDGEWKAVYTEECTEEQITSGDQSLTAADAIDKGYAMTGGGMLYVREYLNPDDDGQAVVAAVRPYAVKKGE